MSGTSADGIDVAITEITGRGAGMSAKLVHHHHRAYDAGLKAAIFGARGPDQRISLAELARMGREISLSYAAAVNEALIATRLTAKDLAAVAAHGQTLYHAPPNTIQWLDPALLAAETGCRVVSDFRRADCAAGGQGAPLVPFADWVLFRDPGKSRVLLNIGGIANMTYIPAGAGIDDVLAFDTGPGNCISDYLVRKHDPAAAGFDEGGRQAARGESKTALADGFIENEYLTRPPPKSTDGPAMIAAWEKSVADAIGREPSLSKLPISDLLATACWMTGTTIGAAFNGFLPRVPDEVIVSGGGSKNAAIMSWLRLGIEEVHQRPLITADAAGVASEAKEAVAFALLGAATLDNEPSNVPSATGARRRVVLGSVTPKP